MTGAPFVRRGVMRWPENPPRGVDVVHCVTLRSYAAAGSPPAVPPPYMTQSMACTPAAIDLRRLGLTLAAIAGITGLLATYRGPIVLMALDNGAPPRRVVR